MQALNPDSSLNGKNEETRVLIAQRTGTCLGNDVLPEADRRAAEVLARGLAEDAIERVRCALSKAIRHAKHLPRHLALKLAHDVDSVSCPFLEVTEVFSDSDWQQLLLTISRTAQVTVARRQLMTESLAVSLAELGDPIVAETLIENPRAPMTEVVCQALMDRLASEVWVLDKLALRNDLVANIIVKLIIRVSEAARVKLVNTYQLQDYTEPVVAEAEIEAVIQTVKQVSVDDLIAVVETLHAQGKLEPLLLLAALRERQINFVEVALSMRAQRSMEHVRSVIHSANLDALKELFKKARIPNPMHEYFLKEIKAVRQ